MAESSNNNPARRPTRQEDLVRLVMIIAVVILANYVGSFWFTRFDLTTEKRYSLSEATKQQVSELEDVVFVKVYLDGELPPALKRLQDATREMLDEYRAYSNGRLEYEFINPAQGSDEDAKQVFQSLADKGLQYTQLEFQSGDVKSDRIIFPGALFAQGNEEVPLQLMPLTNRTDPQIEINQAINRLEYNISTTLKKLTRDKRPVISFLGGHGELTGIEVADITRTLSDFYNLQSDTIDGKLNALNGIDGIIVAGPQTPFSEQDKVVIDQFIMNGGKALWLIDPVQVSMDSLVNRRYTMAMGWRSQLEDQLFKYGVRLNTNLIMDLNSLDLQVNVSPDPANPRMIKFPWVYKPLLLPASDHPIVSNLGPVRSAYASSIDTVGAKNIKKTALLSSSRTTKVMNAPARISLNILRQKPDPIQYTKPPQLAAVLLEGEFTSAFKNTPIAKLFSQHDSIGYREEGIYNRMVVVSDADVIRNPVMSGQRFQPVGYDRDSEKNLSNSNFLFNVLNYLFEDEELIQTRNKEFAIRLLDDQKVAEEKVTWQIINVAAPILLVLIFGLGWIYFRTRRFAH